MELLLQLPVDSALECRVFNHSQDLHSQSLTKDRKNLMAEAMDLDLVQDNKLLLAMVDSALKL